MAYASHQSIRSGFAPFGRVTEAFRMIGDAWSRWRVYTRTYNELSALSTRELTDLGISRSMITRLAYEAAYGRDA